MFVSKLIEKILRHKITKIIEPFGEFRYSKRYKDWLCYSPKILTYPHLEISFDVENEEQELSNKVNLTLAFLQNIESIKNDIYETIAKDYARKPIEEVKEMWFLSGIHLLNDDKTWHIVFEPNVDVETIYNHFLRFSVVNNEIVWNNF
jgi:hypothetical protein